MFRDHDLRPSGAERSRDSQFEGRELDRDSRGGSDPRHALPRDPRDVFTRGLALPRGNRRQRITVRDRTFEVVGILEPTLSTPDVTIAVPFSVAQALIHADLPDVVRAAGFDVDAQGEGMDLVVVATRPVEAG